MDELSWAGLGAATGGRVRDRCHSAGDARHVCALVGGRLCTLGHGRRIPCQPLALSNIGTRCLDVEVIGCHTSLAKFFLLEVIFFRDVALKARQAHLCHEP
jgi:hypothetical protein